MEILVSLLLVLYLVMLAQAKYTWQQIPPATTAVNYQQLPGVTIVIAARNEENNVERLIESLGTLDYPKDRLEVIIVNDASEDRTEELLEYHTKNRPEIKCLTLQEKPGFKGSYKKRALTSGIESAKHGVIVTTDADCQFHPGWLLAMVRTMSEFDLVMASGPVLFQLEGPLYDLLNIELASLVAIGAVSLEKGHPNMCNGANLAFTKKAFEKVKGYSGYEQVISGDDEFLLYKIFIQYPRKVRFVKNKRAIVKTDPPKSWDEFINQRKRWSGKWKSHQSFSTRLLAIFVFIFHLSFMSVATMTVFGKYSWKIFLFQLILKLLMEYFFISPVLGFMGKRIALQWFFFMQLLYSFYVSTVGVAVQFSGFKWKNRTYQ